MPSENEQKSLGFWVETTTYIITAVGFLAYAFTLGFLDKMKIPEMPDYLTATRFFFKNVLLYFYEYWFCLVMFFLSMFLVVIVLNKVRQQLTHIFSGISDHITNKIFVLVVYIFLLLVAFAFGQSRAPTSPAEMSNHFPVAAHRYDKASRLGFMIWSESNVQYWIICEFFDNRIIGVNRDEGRIFYYRPLDVSERLRFCVSN